MEKLTSVKVQSIIDMNKPSKQLYGHILRFGRLKKNERRFPLTFSSRKQADNLYLDLIKLKGNTMKEVEGVAGIFYNKYKKFNYK